MRAAVQMLPVGAALEQTRPAGWRPGPACARAGARLAARLFFFVSGRAAFFPGRANHVA